MFSVIEEIGKRALKLFLPNEHKPVSKERTETPFSACTSEKTVRKTSIILKRGNFYKSCDDKE